MCTLTIEPFCLFGIIVIALCLELILCNVEFRLRYGIVFRYVNISHIQDKQVLSPLNAILNLEGANEKFYAWTEKRRKK